MWYLQSPSARLPMFCEPNLECPASFPSVGTPTDTLLADSFAIHLIDHPDLKVLLSSSKRPLMFVRPTSTFLLVSHFQSFSHMWNPSSLEELHLSLLPNLGRKTVWRHVYLLSRITCSFLLTVWLRLTSGKMGRSPKSTNSMSRILKES